MHVTVRIRIFLARHAWVRWAIIVALTVAVGWTVHHRGAAVERERASWGATIDVVVARSDLQPDGAIDAAIVAMPAAMVPPAALTALAPDTRLRRHVVIGAVLTSADVTVDPGPAAFAEDGTAVVGVIDPLARSASIGLQVAVTSEGVTLAERASIVGVDTDVIFVAVPEAAAPMVAAAAQIGNVSLIFLR